jgi:hypothetical protein
VGEAVVGEEEGAVEGADGGGIGEIDRVTGERMRDDEGREGGRGAEERGEIVAVAVAVTRVGEAARESGVLRTAGFHPVMPTERKEEPRREANLHEGRGVRKLNHG